MAITNLQQYYQSQGQTLPSVQSRTATATSAGVSNYTGTASQNAQVLSYLQSGASGGATSKPIVTNSGSAQNQTNSNVAYLNTQNAGTTQNPTNGVNNGSATGTSGTNNGAVNTTNNEVATMNANISTQLTQMQTDNASMYANLQNQYAQLKTSNDALYNKTIDSLNSRYDSLKTQLKDANSRFLGKTEQQQYSINGFRYTPEQAEGLVYQAETAGINRLQDLENERTTMILKANEAKLNEDYKALDTQRSLMEANSASKLKAITNMQTYAKSVQNQIETANAKSTANFQKSYKDLDQAVPVYMAYKDQASKDNFIQRYAQAMGQTPEATKAMFENYTSTQQQYNTNVKATPQGKTTTTTNAKGQTSTSTVSYGGNKSTGSNNTGGSATQTGTGGGKNTKTNSSTSTNTDTNKNGDIPDTPKAKTNEIKKDMRETKGTNPEMFDKNGYLHKEAEGHIIKQYLKQGYSEKEIKEALDGFTYDGLEEDTLFERIGTTFGYKR